MKEGTITKYKIRKTPKHYALEIYYKSSDGWILKSITYRKTREKALGLIHKNEKPNTIYKCIICDAMFHKRRGVNKHLKEKHNMIRNLKRYIRREKFKIH